MKKDSWFKSNSRKCPFYNMALKQHIQGKKNKLIEESNTRGKDIFDIKYDDDNNKIVYLEGKKLNVKDVFERIFKFLGKEK